MSKLFSKAMLQTMAIIVPIIFIETTSNIIQHNITAPGLRIFIGILILIIAITMAVKLNQLSHSADNLIN